MSKAVASPYPKFKLWILILLTINVFIYAAIDTLTTSADALAWVLLLLSFELEAQNKPICFSPNTLHNIRNALITAIVLVFLFYIHDNDWLDVINAVIWFALIALLELEIRWSATVAKYRYVLHSASIALFISLLGMVVCWLWHSAWLDAYDAALWIAAFALIEVDIARFLQIRQEPV